MLHRRSTTEQPQLPKPRREGRGLGPFTSGHLTIIVIVVVLVVAFPFAAFAVTGSNVFVTDATSGNQAQVASGQLKVDTGISHPFGLVPVAPVAPEIYPTGDIVHTDVLAVDAVDTDNCGSGTCQTVLKPPAGKAAVITTIHINTYKATATGSGQYLALPRSGNGSCAVSSIDRRIEFLNPAGIGETQLQYDLPGGLAVPAGKALCVFNSDPANLGAQVSARGYAVAPSAVPG
jgi:hypothetical protein